MLHRDEQFVSFMKKEVAIFLDRNVARPEGSFFSVTHVAVDQSGARAEIFISIFPDSVVGDLMKTLKGYEGPARAHLADLMRRRKIPFLVFVLDRNQEKQIRLEKLLENEENK